jgi:hypothetical protein
MTGTVFQTVILSLRSVPFKRLKGIIKARAVLLFSRDLRIEILEYRSGPGVRIPIHSVLQLRRI